MKKRRTGFQDLETKSFCAVTEDVWMKSIVRKTLAGCAPGYEINVHGAKSFAEKPRMPRHWET